jgi:hypothetical protein
MVSLLRRFLEAASLDRRTFGPGKHLMLHCTIDVKPKLSQRDTAPYIKFIKQLHWVLSAPGCSAGAKVY